MFGRGYPSCKVQEHSAVLHAQLWPLVSRNPRFDPIPEEARVGGEMRASSSFPLFFDDDDVWHKRKKMRSPPKIEPLQDALMGQDGDLVMAAAASPGMKYGSVEPAKNGELAPRESQSSGGT